MSTSGKKPKATPTSNHFGLTPREAEIAILAWKCVDPETKASTQTTPSTPKATNKHTHSHSHASISSTSPCDDRHNNAPRKSNKATDNSLAPHPKQVDMDKLSVLAGIPLADSAGRVMRTIKSKIKEAAMPSGGGSDAAGVPGTPAAPATPDDGGAADPGSPSLLASKNKKKSVAAALAASTGGKTAKRKRTVKEAGVGDGADAGDNKETEGGQKPKAKRVKAAARIVTLKEEPNPFSSDMEAGEV